MSNDPIQQAYDMALSNRARLDNLLDWLLYAKRQLNGDENPALVEALNAIGVGLASAGIDADQFVQVMAGLMEALREAVRQRDSALERAHQLQCQQSDFDQAVSEGIAYLLTMDPDFYQQQIDDLARQILTQGISETALLAQEKLMEQIQEAERRARQLEANLSAVYVDDPDPIGEE